MEDLDLRIHHHSQMATAGLRRVIALCRTFNFEQLNTQLDVLQDTIENDEKELRERLDQEVLRDMTNIEDVYAALKSRTDNTRAHDYLLSILQHFLLIREDGPGVVQYYQLLDSLVTDIVMDHKLAGAEQRLGKSVESIIAQFNDADQYRILEADSAKMRADLRRLQLEKDALESEVITGGDGLVGVLRGKVASLEEKLQISRETTARLQTQLETQKANYEEQVTQLEAQIMELFRMLKELGSDGVGRILENNGTMDRKVLIATLEKHVQRAKTIDILEGRNRDAEQRKKGKEGQDGDQVESDDPDATPRKSKLKRQPHSKRGQQLSEALPGRPSQFMDADEADVKEQIQQQLAAGVMMVSGVKALRSYAILTRISMHQGTAMLLVREASINPHDLRTVVWLTRAHPQKGQTGLASLLVTPDYLLFMTTRMRTATPTVQH
jgi:cytokinesis protein